MKPSLWSRFIKWCGFVFDSIANFISRNFGSNVGLKIFAVVLSFVIIYVISERTGVVKEFTVPVKIVMNTKNTALSSYSPTEVQVELKGTLEDLNIVDASLLSAEIVIRDDYASGQEITRKLYSTNIRNNGNLRIEDITPDRINIVFDKEARYRIPVALPKLEGNPLQGGTASVRFVAGNEVVVTGSELMLARLVEGGLELSTRPIDVTDRSNSFERNVELIFPPDIGVISIEPKTLMVAVDIVLPQIESVSHSMVQENPSEEQAQEANSETTNGENPPITPEEENSGSSSSEKKSEE